MLNLTRLRRENSFFLLSLGEVLHLGFSAMLEESVQVSVLLTNEDLLRDVVEMLRNPNCYLLADATAGIVTSAGGINGDNVYLYVLMAAVPTNTLSPDYFLVFGYMLSCGQHAVLLEVHNVYSIFNS